MRWAAIAVLWAGLAAGVAAQSSRDEVAIQQIGHGDYPRLTFAVDVVQANGEPVPSLRVDQVTVRGPAAITVRSVERLRPTDGTAYIVLLDVSRSLSKTQYEEILRSLQRWIREMSARDRMAIVTFGNTVQVKQDFTSDQSVLLQATASLGAVDSLTHLYAAFRKAIELARRTDPDLPMRRTVMILSDGRNSEHNTGLTEDDVVRDLEKAPVPIYAIDASSGQGAAATVCSPTLARVTTVTNGVCEKLGATSLDVMYQRMRAAMSRVFVIDAACERCPVDGVRHDYSVAVAVGNAIHQSEVRAMAIGAPWQAPASRLLVTIVALGALLLVAAAVWWWWRLRASKSPAAVPLSGAGTAIVSETPKPPQPVVFLQFVIVGGQRSGFTFDAPLHHRVVLGRGPGCDVRIDGDDDVADVQCEFTWRDGMLFVHPLATAPTVVGGAPTRFERPVESGETLRVGQTELRVLVHPVVRAGV